MGYSHGICWNHELIVQGVQEVVNGLRLDRMPTAKECATFFGNECLSQAIAKHSSYYQIANELGLPVKKGNTTLGKSYEHKATEKLITLGYIVEQMPQNYPYDLLINDRVKIDVKASRLYRSKNGAFYSYGIDKPYATCDLYILYALSPENTVVRVIPAIDVIKNKQISIGSESSMYDKYIDRYDLIGLYNDFLKGVSL